MSAILILGVARKANPIINLISAMATERAYQLRRWGIRQPDGTFLDKKSSSYQYLCYIVNYVDEAIKQLTTEAGSEHALGTIRKIATLAYVAVDSHGCDPLSSIGAETEVVTNGGASVAYFLMLMKGVCHIATEDMTESEDAKAITAKAMHGIFDVCVACSKIHNIPNRIIDDTIINGRDGQPSTTA